MFHKTNLSSKQKGMTAIGLVAAIVLGISAFVMMAKLVPPYLESMSIKNALEGLAQEPNIEKMSAYKIQDLLSRKLSVNSVKSVKANDLVVTREGQGLVFNLKYEIRVHAVGNVDAVLSFDQKVSTE